MNKIILTVGIPASFKSTWAKAEVASNPEKIVRVNRDSLREMINNFHFCDSTEKMITSITNFTLQQALKAGKDVILDQTNINRKNFNDICKIVKGMNIDCIVMEKPFFVELDVAILADSKREGHAKVGEDVVKKFWKKSGGTLHKHYKPRVETFLKQKTNLKWKPLVQDASKPNALICDLDGTLAIIGDRSPYSAENCDIVDSPNIPVVDTVSLYYDVGYKIIFCSGRMEKDRAPTERFIKKCLPNIEYILLMRSDGDQRKDFIIKEELFNNFILNKYNVKLVLDDRLSVCRKWHNIGLNLFRIGDPDSDF